MHVSVPSVSGSQWRFIETNPVYAQRGKRNLRVSLTVLVIVLTAYSFSVPLCLAFLTTEEAPLRNQQTTAKDHTLNNLGLSQRSKTKGYGPQSLATKAVTSLSKRSRRSTKRQSIHRSMVMQNRFRTNLPSSPDSKVNDSSISPFREWLNMAFVHFAMFWWEWYQPANVSSRKQSSSTVYRLSLKSEVFGINYRLTISCRKLIKSWSTMPWPWRHGFFRGYNDLMWLFLIFRNSKIFTIFTALKPC